jgi:hypothetical protein
MPLRGKTNEATDAASKKAAGVLEQLSKPAPDVEKYKHATEVIGIRLPSGEKERLKTIFAQKGLTFSQAAKIAVYRFAEDLVSGKITLLDTNII